VDFHGSLLAWCLVIDRPRHSLAIRRALRRSGVVSILGARQVGKTTLARLAAGSRGTWFDLEGTFVVRVLRSWHENLAKRQVKAPKVYVADSGMLHALLGIDTRHELDRHPKVEASWEGFALEQVIARLGVRPRDCYFWATHQGAELDLLVVRGTKRRGFEFKRADAPTTTASMRIAMQDLRLDSIEVIHPGAHSYPLASKIRAVAIADLWRAIAPL
jgi:predicted AAA+ superfamily ATPase